MDRERGEGWVGGWWMRWEGGEEGEGREKGGGGGGQGLYTHLNHED